MDHRCLVNLFRGLWTFSRTISSLSDDAHLIAQITEGKASFIPWKHPQKADKIDWLLYREKGQMVNMEHPSASGSITRQYLYEFVNENMIKAHHCHTHSRDAQIMDPWNEKTDLSQFEYDKFFHQLEFSKAQMNNIDGMTSVFVHLCDPDTYKGEHEINSQTSYQTSWVVTGPQKSYRIDTQYTKKIE